MSTNMRIKIVSNTLTDNSKTFDVILHSTEQRSVIRLDAISEQDAWWFVEKLKAALGEHTNTEIESD